MNRNDDARRAILGSIRRSLTESAPHDAVHAQRHQPPTPASRGKALPVMSSAAAAAMKSGAPQPGATNDPVDRFRERLEAVAGRSTVARGAPAVGEAIQRILESTGARRVAASDSPRVLPFVAEACEGAGAELLVDAPSEALFDCDVGVSTAQWGIAETGTLVLESRLERHRLVSLIPRVHIALLRTDRLCDTLGEALRHVRSGAAEGEVPSAAITLVTGPSRTSDIELTLAIGVHGPQELHVIMIEPAPGAAEGLASPDASTPDPGRSA